MSTYYKFRCRKCFKASKGIFTRQMWGWGNVDIIDCFQFIMKHTAECGHRAICVVCEDDDNQEYDLSEDDIDHDSLNRYFPHSNDWDEKLMHKRFDEYRETCKKRKE